jgi:hypothetical protein
MPRFGGCRRAALDRKVVVLYLASDNDLSV